MRHKDSRSRADSKGLLRRLAPFARALIFPKSSENRVTTQLVSLKSMTRITKARDFSLAMLHLYHFAPGSGRHSRHPLGNAHVRQFPDISNRLAAARVCAGFRCSRENRVFQHSIRARRGFCRATSRRIIPAGVRIVRECGCGVTERGGVWLAVVKQAVSLSQYPSGGAREFQGSHQSSELG